MENLKVNWLPNDRGEWTPFDKWWFKRYAAIYPDKNKVSILLREVAQVAFEADPWYIYDHWWHKTYADRFSSNDAISIQVRQVALNAFEAGKHDGSKTRVAAVQGGGNQSALFGF